MMQNKNTSFNYQQEKDLIKKDEIYGSNLLDRPHPEGYKEEWTESLKHSSTEEIIETSSLLVFRIKNEWFALPTYCIIEVTKASFIHSLPHANSHIILGITNVQGELRIAICLKSLLGLPDDPIAKAGQYTYSKYMRNVVFGNKKDIFVFPVEEIFGLIHIKLDAIEPVPINVSKSLKNFFSGIFVLPEEKLSVGLLDEKLIINIINENYL